MSDYLWDRSDPPDRDVQRLEELLSEFAYQSKPPVRRTPWFKYGAIAASIAAVAAISIYAWRAQTRGWLVASLEGAPRIGSSRISDKGTLGTGQWLETDSKSRARVEIGTIGDVEVSPDSRVGMIRARATEQRMALERGRIRASIYAPPRIFIVDTPAATAVDLGCVYTLAVDASGSGLLNVIAGWVSLEGHGRESLVPANASCRTRTGAGPGTPYFDDARQALVDALNRFDFEDSSDAALLEVITAAQKQDTLTLWHLLRRSSGSSREAVYQRLAAVAPPPKGVTRAGVLSGDSTMLELWWDSLGLGSASLWRTWKKNPLGTQGPKRNPIP